MTTTAISPNVRLPMGTMGYDWQPASSHSGMPYRFVFGVSRPVGDVWVRASACQFADGSLDDGSKVEAPGVFINDEQLPNDRVRELIEVLQKALAQVEEWQTRSRPSHV
jgi:hypothetical protein